MTLEDLQVTLFCDSADLGQMEAMKARGLVQGFTCNPSLVRKAGVADYLAFCRAAVALCRPLPLSLEVIADSPREIIRQAELLNSLGDNVVVKIPIVTPEGLGNQTLIALLAKRRMALNITACFTGRHVRDAQEALLSSDSPAASYISIFAGRIADSGRCPEQLVSNAAWFVQGSPTKIIWASVREPYNVVQANRCGCHVITVFPSVLARLDRFGRDLDEFARETSEMFSRDASEAGYSL